VTYSEEFDDASWTKVGSTVTANAAVAPDGTITADLLVASTASSRHNIFSGAVIPSSNGYTAAYVKANGYEKVAILEGQAGLTAAAFDLSTGEILYQALNSNASITSVGNGWFRIGCVAARAAGSRCDITILPPNYSTGNVLITWVGDGVSGIYIWGAQLEASSFPTSYIKTEASQVTRSADSASMVGANFSSWYRADKSSFYVDFKGASAVSTSNSILYNSSTPASTTNGYKISTSVVVPLLTSGANGWSSTGSWLSTGYQPNQQTKLTFAFENGSCAVVTNGTVQETNTEALALVTPASLTIGSAFTGHYKKISYYPARLDNTQLQALTS
jgi:hypothetical protein